MPYPFILALAFTGNATNTFNYRIFQCVEYGFCISTEIITKVEVQDSVQYSGSVFSCAVILTNQLK